MAAQLTVCAVQVQSDGQRRAPVQALIPSDGPAPLPRPSPGQVNRKTVRGRTYYLVRWQADLDSWEPAKPR